MLNLTCEVTLESEFDTEIYFRRYSSQDSVPRSQTMMLRFGIWRIVSKLTSYLWILTEIRIISSMVVLVESKTP